MDEDEEREGKESDNGVWEKGRVIIELGGRGGKGCREGERTERGGE